jgi:hypothetical protein
MIKELLLILMIFAQAVHYAQAGNNNSPVGARSRGMGNANVTLRDEWSLFNNIGGLAGVRTITGAVFFENRFGLKSFNTVAAAFVLPTKGMGAVGLNVRRFGDDLYNEHLVGLGYSHKINNVTLGLQVNYMQTTVSDLGARHAFTINFGGVAEIIPQLVFGAHIFNLNQAKMAEYSDERIPTIVKVGLSYRPLKQLMLNVETEKDIDYKASFRAGVEYKIIEKVCLRTGISTEPYINYFGVGFVHKRLRFDYAVSTHPKLPWSNHLSLSYTLTSRKAQ